MKSWPNHVTPYHFGAIFTQQRRVHACTGPWSQPWPLPFWGSGLVTRELILMQTHFVWRQLCSTLHWKPTFSATSARSTKHSSNHTHGSWYEKLIVHVCRKCNVCCTYLVSANVCRDERDTPQRCSGCAKCVALLAKLVSCPVHSNSEILFVKALWCQ